MTELLDHPFLHPERAMGGVGGGGGGVSLTKEQVMELLAQVWGYGGVGDGEVGIESWRRISFVTSCLWVEVTSWFCYKTTIYAHPPTHIHAHK